MSQIGAIASAISALITVGYKVVALFVEAKKNGWIKDSNSLRERIANANSNEEREKLARDLFNHEPK